MTGDCVQRFMLDDLDIRGAVVRLGAVWRQLLTDRDYPAPVVDLLGRMSATSLLLADNLKQPGRLTIQLRGNGPVSLLVIDCNETLNTRCMAQHDEEIDTTADIDLLGDGQLLLSLDTPARRKPYQSIVPLAGKNIAEIFEHYLMQSEQLASRFFLAATPTGVAGLFLQKMPTTDERDSDGWTRIEALAATAKPKELLELPIGELLTRLFHEETIRLFAARAVTNNSPEDWEKVGNMLRSLGREEVYGALSERGEILVRDDLGNREYRFDKRAIDALFSNTPETPPTVH
ncbi:Hsp33 protein [Candidatus Propionivibrio aalborgensis]|uniref:Hsp33 protein n=1 Tax=Candidatus Propionivibrio aalborgensis TaxID=1860101 RepID=A0A1A8XJF4_9RHOO|nr:Hsp33 family molecular chaperone HslO [Candidatus Propionivibrio aalborgensis]MBK7327014.1 Hsp33 family molecular chaperone HslO [Propionivibrio sp.]MBK7565908.1 Hsp33 family molecular chaperone HslO [Propionivibrio sp.]MBK9026526.1 Hsp33 family molecular chaperone HslO [Propionivibrio sp.]SBT05270.1 Hsp33 protein [Candidatus Propionivibrio aalborgensis]HRC59558.1 Hsp33 family molecular chaperone HslO [Candidatus Propionivibrio aalborgensis]